MRFLGFREAPLSASKHNEKAKLRCPYAAWSQRWRAEGQEHSYPDLFPLDPNSTFLGNGTALIGDAILVLTIEAGIRSYHEMFARCFALVACASDGGTGGSVKAMRDVYIYCQGHS